MARAPRGRGVAEIESAPREPPTCQSCGRKATDLRASFIDPGKGRTIQIYRCECGKLVWHGYE
jgi:hypothetical protein